MTCLINLPTQRATLFRRHAIPAAPAVLLRLVLRLRLRLRVRRLHARIDLRLHLLHCPHIALAFLSRCLTLLARLAVIAVALTTIAVARHDRAAACCQH
ncbi:MAG: hypothetical protein H7244_05920 [Herminiimonas sp.]|nr:hypothetical protein [Herminiimonas sp.]